MEAKGDVSESKTAEAKESKESKASPKEGATGLSSAERKAHHRRGRRLSLVGPGGEEKKRRESQMALR